MLLRFLLLCTLFSSWYLEGTVTWTTPERPTSYLFAPGIHMSERHVVKYCQHYTASTGQVIYTSNDFTVINPKYVTAVNFPEIILDKAHKKPVPFWRKSILYLYNTILTARNNRNDRTTHITTIDNNNTNNVMKPFICLDAVNFAQENDIQALSVAYDAHVAKWPETDIVLYGVSRGAATAFNFLATTYQTKAIKNVKAVVLEGCFDTIENVLRQQLPLLHKTQKSSSLLFYLFARIYPSYDKNGINPRNAATTFPHEIPVLFVTSKRDAIVPPPCVYNIYNALKEAGHEHTYLLTLPTGPHHSMMSNEQDKSLYQAAVHNFYSNYRLAHDTTFACRGQQLLEECTNL